MSQQGEGASPYAKDPNEWDDDDINALLDEAVSRNGEGRQEARRGTTRPKEERLGKKPAGEKAPKEPRAASDVAKELFGNTNSAIEEALTGLSELFGVDGSTKLRGGFPGDFNEETYAKAKPHFAVAWEAAKAAAGNVKELLEIFLDKFVAAFGEGMRPYLVQWIKEHRAELSDFQKEKGSDLTQRPEGGTALTQAFVKALEADRLPGDNRALRQFVSEQLGGVEVDNARLKVAQEELEAALAIHARNLIARGGDERALYDQLVALYNAQPNLDLRTSGSIERQAYSTPLPLAFAAALTAKTRGAQVYEPAAGNGLLLIDTRPGQAVANELDGVRARNLQGQGFKTIQSDAVSAVPDGRVAPAAFDAVIANPPFGKAPEPVAVQGYKLEKIEHIIAARSLLAMRSDGRATLILAADKVEPGAIKGTDRVFYNWLYENYNVVGNFEVDGKLYSRQGASWPVRVITVAGRNVSDRVAPASLPAERVATWEGVYEQAEQTVSAMVESNVSDAEFIASIADSADLKAPGEQSGLPGGGGTETGPTGETGVAGGGEGGRGPGAGPGGSGGSGNGGRSGGATGDGRRGGRGDNSPGLGTGESAGPESDRPQDTRDDAAGGRARGDERALDSGELQVAYKGVAKGQYADEGVLTPVNMRDALHQALTAIRDEVGSLEEYVREKLGYDTLDEVTADLMGLQIDTVAAAIYNIEHGTGVVIADQTGVGKGRQAAAIIRYAHRTGRTPIFATKGPDLFTDMYRDLAAIGSGDLAPFIMNADVKIMDEDGELVVHKSLDSKKINEALDKVAATGTLPDGFDMLFFSYPQIQNPEQAKRKVSALNALAENAILILDESHEAAGGSSNRGEVMRPLVNAAAGVTYLSATFAKRADTMGLYFRTVLGKMVDSVDELISIMETGGDQLQAILSNTLSRAGQLFRRERSFKGIDTIEVRDTDNRGEHSRQADEATRALRDIIRADTLFQKDAGKWKQWLVEQGYASIGKGNKIAETITNTSFASVAHNYIRQLMLGLKAGTAAERAIAALKRGERPTIALEHTMGSFLSEFVESKGAKEGDELVGFDYRYVLARGLARSRRIKIKDKKGNEAYVTIPLEILSTPAIEAYEQALETIKRANVGIPVSPIDWIRQKLADAGYSSKEITNRNLTVDYTDPAHPKLTTRDSAEFDKVKSRAEFNSGQVDVLIMNVSGATGASLHSSETFKDQRRRMMIVAQPMADINMFMQMLGRINRTGQVSSREAVTKSQALPKGAIESYGLPYYELLSADLPAEVRPTAILMKKMKSLNANVSSNTDSANTLDSALDLFNKYGDQVVLDYLRENREMGELFGPMIGSQSEKAPPDFAAKVTGKLALLPVKKQIEFYDDVAPAYQSHMDYLDSVGQNDLKITVKDLKAKPIGDPPEVIYQTPPEIAYIVPNAFLGKYAVGKLTHPPTAREVQEALDKERNGVDPEVYIEGVVVAKEANEKVYADHLQEEHAAALKDADDQTLSNEKRTQARARAERLQAELESLVGQRRAFRQTMNHGFRPGTVYNVDIDGQLMNGVVTKVKDVSKPNNTNPYAESKTEVTFMVNGDIRHFKMPLSKLNSRDVLQGRSWRADIEQAFSEQKAASTTEERWLLTGNILGGLSRMDPEQKREIAYVTMADGEIVPAVIMPLSFGPSSGTIKRDVSMRYPKAVAEFLSYYREDADISRFGVTASDNTLRIVPSGSSEFRVRVPRGKSTGGKWHQNKKLTDITGEFVQSSREFMDVTVNADQLERLLAIVLEQVSIYAPESQAEKAQPFVDRHAASYSRGSAGARPLADVRADLKALLAPNNALLKSGRLRVVQSDSDLPGHLQVDGGGVKGVVDPVDGKIYLVADNIGDNVKGVFLHEVGVHAGLKSLLGDKYADVIRQMRGLRAIKQAAAVNAYARVPADTLEAHRDEEALAYLVEDAAAADMSVVKKVLVAVRAWLFRHGILVKSLTVEDMLALAAAAARSYGSSLEAQPLTETGGPQPPYSRLSDVIDRFQDARRAEPASEFAEQNRRIREKHRPMWYRAKQILKRQLSPGGLLPEDVFKLKIQRDSTFEVAELDIRSLLAHYEDALKAAYKMAPDKLPNETQQALKQALQTPDPANYPDGIPESVADHIFALRQYIDRLSTEYQAILFDQAAALQADGKDGAAAAKAELLQTIASRMGEYVHRSYRAFDDPNWPKKVPDAVLDDARRYLMDQYEAKAQQYDAWAARARERGELDKAARHADRAAVLRDPERPEQTLQSILKEGTAFDSMEAFIKESKLGAKDLTILKRRKDIAPPIRALLGEYVDPRIGFAKSATKMNRLIFNQRFLDKVREIGLGSFLFSADERPAEAWKQIAAPSTEAYAPLAGYYTYPEVEQAFRDALGKEQMADWYRTVVKLNGIVKYGKTVLSPTTAMRNWMSAMFFAVANGHFDITQVRHSVKSLREYFTHKGDGLAYLRKLKHLGVIYDTPYAGEMIRLLKESRIEDQLVGGGRLGIKQALGLRDPVLPVRRRLLEDHGLRERGQPADQAQGVVALRCRAAGRRADPQHLPDLFDGRAVRGQAAPLPAGRHVRVVPGRDHPHQRQHAALSRPGHEGSRSAAAGHAPHRRVGDRRRVCARPAARLHGNGRGG